MTEPAKVIYGEPVYDKDGGLSVSVKISHKDPMEVERARLAFEIANKMFKENMK